MMSLRPALFIASISCLLTACVVEQPDLSRYIGSDIDNLEEAIDIDMSYSDSSRLVFRLTAPRSRRVITRYATMDEFPDGIDVTFYAKSGRAVSWLTADFALRDQANRIIRVQKNVVLRNDLGERLDSPELIWDERAREIHTDRFVKITRPDGSVIYSYGLRSNETFTRYELNAVTGDLPMPRQGGAGSDSTSAPR